MKKILSIFLIACMLLSLSIVAFAAEGEDDGTNAELEALGYVGISTEDELKSKTGKFYLKNDITITSGKGGNKTDTYIDGNGHTVTLDGGLSMVNWGKNVEMRNITIEGTVLIEDGTTTEAVFDDRPEGGKNDSSHYGPFSIHGIDEKLVVQNCHSKVDITINNTVLPGSIGGFLGKSHGSDATWENVSYTGKLTIGNGTMTNTASQEMRTIGGIAGMSGSNLKAINVNVDAEIVCNAKDVAGLGGLFGVTREGDNRFTNCSFNGSITFGGTCAPENGVGGIAGWCMGTPFVAEGLNNYGDITANNPENVGAVGGIFGHVNANKSHMNFDKVVNAGKITGTKTAGGVVGEFTSGAELAEEEPGFTLSSVMNNGDVTAPYAAGGLIGKMNQLVPDFVVTFKDVVNIANVSATAVTSGEEGAEDYVAGAEGAGAVVGVMPAAPEGEGAVYSFVVATIYHIGTVSGENSTPLLKIPTEWCLGETKDNYYSQTVEGEHFGEKKDEQAIRDIVNQIDFSFVSTYPLMLALRLMEGKLEIDYTAETWAAVQTAITAGNEVIANKDAKDEDIATAAKNIEDAVAALVLKPLDKTTFDKLLADIAKLNKADYRGDTWRNITRALEEAEAELTKQSEINAVVETLQKAIDGLVLVSEDTVEATEAPTAEATEAPTAAPTEKPTEPVKKGGCGSAITATAVVLTAVLALGTGVAFKKKED